MCRYGRRCAELRFGAMSEHHSGIKVFIESVPVRVAEIAAGPIVLAITFVLSSGFRTWLTRSLPAWLHENALLIAAICVLLTLALLLSVSRARREHRSLRGRLEQEVEARKASERRGEERQADLLGILSDTERQYSSQIARLIEEIEGLRKEPKDRDREQFAQFIQTIPPDSRSLAALRNYWPLTNLRRSLLEPFHNYLARAWEADLEFVDKELEDARRSFSAALREFSGHLSSIIWQSSEQPYEGDTLFEMATEWQRTAPQRWGEAVETTDRLAGGVVEAYDLLIRLGRRKGL